MLVKFLDLAPAYESLKLSFDNVWYTANQKAEYILGPHLLEFEKNFSQYLNSKHFMGVANGLDALSLGLRALDIGANDQVIVPAHTFIATWLAVSSVGAIPVPVEVDEFSYNLDPRLIENAITPATKAIIVVHLYGRAANMSAINEIARRYDLKVIEDAAQAHGACHAGKKVGSLGAIGAFSFYPGKNLGGFGDGGGISCADDKIFNSVKLLRNYGSTQRYCHEIIGYNSRLDELQAGVLNVKLKALDEHNKRRREIARIYNSELSNIENLILPQEGAEENEHVWHLYVVRSPDRDALKDYLKDNQIESLIHYPCPPHLQAAYRSMGYGEGAFPITEKISKEILSLPMGPFLKDDQVGWVVDNIKRFFSTRSDQRHKRT